jgi:hypothetical protein
MYSKEKYLWKADVYSYARPEHTFKIEFTLLCITEGWRGIGKKIVPYLTRKLGLASEHVSRKVTSRDGLITMYLSTIDPTTKHEIVQGKFVLTKHLVNDGVDTVKKIGYTKSKGE